MVEKRSRKTVVLSALMFAASYLVCALLCFLPRPHKIFASEESYEAVWEDGARSEESFSSAYSALAGGDGEGAVLLRGGMQGRIAAGEQYRACYSVLQDGDLLSLLNASFGGLSRIERAALMRTFGDTVYFSDDFFAFDGERVFRTDRRSFGTIVLLDGSFPAGTVALTGAEKLTVRAEAMLSAEALCGTEIAEIEAEAPYFVRDGGLYLRTPGGTRLVAALPCLTRFEADGFDFCDEGALSPCRGLTEVSLPYAGSAQGRAGSDYDSRVLWAFGEEIPSALRRIAIGGGSISRFAFLGCGGVEEIDLCGIPAEEIEEGAFAPCKGLLRLHTAAEFKAEGFSASPLPCGCTLYERRNNG